MRAGFGTAPLAVRPGTRLGGYADRDGLSTGTLDPLGAHCVYLDSGAGGLVLVVVDVVGVNADLAAAVTRAVTAALGAPVEVWTMATHTHAGPEVGCRPGGVTPPSWTSRIVAAATAAATAASSSTVDCAVRRHTGALDGIGAVRADRHAAASVPVDVLSFVDATGRTRGVLAVVPVHPTVLPAGNLMVSGDLAGAIRGQLAERLADRYGRPAVVVATGAAGDISTRATRRAQTPQECARLGASAADQLAGILDSSPLAEEAGAVELRTARHRLTVPARRDEAQRLAALRDRLLVGSTVDNDDPVAARIAHTAVQGMDLALARADQVPADGYPIELAAARIGRIELAGMGVEPFLAIRGMLGAAPPVLFGYANGYAGYLPDAAAYRQPGYEVYASPFGPGTAELTAAALTDLLHPLRTKKGSTA